MQTSEVLNLAADEIQRRGWVQQQPGWHDPWGGGAATEAPICLEGGIAAAIGLRIPPRTVGFNPVRNDAIEALQSCPAYVAVSRHLGYDIEGRDVYEYNDSDGRTADEVIAVLRATALIEAARERQPEQVTR